MGDGADSVATALAARPYLRGPPGNVRRHLPWPAVAAVFVSIVRPSTCDDGVPISDAPHLILMRNNLFQHAAYPFGEARIALELRMHEQ
jgi:hypothetical protein